jgi:hypothetical protein
MRMRNLSTFLDGKPELKRPLGRPRRRRQGNIKNEFGEIGCRVVDWICLAQDRNCWKLL